MRNAAALVETTEGNQNFWDQAPNVDDNDDDDDKAKMYKLL